ncbi:winged helix-turn-helix domain-containing protein [Rhizobium mongolense]
MEKTVILALKSVGDLSCNFGDDLYQMELSLRVLPTPNEGRLIDAVTVEEIDEVRGDVLVFTEILSVDFSLIDLLVHSFYGNLVVAGKAHSQGSLRILTNKSRLTATLPRRPANGQNFSAELSPVGVYKFTPTFLRSIARNRPHRSNDDLEFFEVALGLQAHKIHVIHGGTSVPQSDRDRPTLRLIAKTVTATSDHPTPARASSTHKLLTFLELELDMHNYRVRRNGRIVHLNPTAFRLLHHFMKEPRRVCSGDELKDAAWPDDVHVGPRTVDVHIGHLRAALNAVGGLDLIRTVRSVGYALSW